MEDEGDEAVAALFGLLGCCRNRRSSSEPLDRCEEEADGGRGMWCCRHNSALCLSSELLTIASNCSSKLGRVSRRKVKASSVSAMMRHSGSAAATLGRACRWLGGEVWRGR